MGYAGTRAAGIHMVAPSHRLKDEALADKATQALSGHCPAGPLSDPVTNPAILSLLHLKNAVFFEQQLVSEEQLYFCRDSKEQLHLMPSEQLFLPAPALEEYPGLPPV
jgi:hypothetical protein